MPTPPTKTRPPEPRIPSLSHPAVSPPTIESVPHTLSTSPAQSSALHRIRSGRFDAPAPLALWHLASLDAPTVAVVWSLAFAWAGHVRLPSWIPALLALAGWAVYVADRLLDTRAALRSGRVGNLRERHCFHHRHRRLLAPLAIAAAIAACAIVVTLMPVAARERNSVLAVAALAYFTRVHAAPGRFHSSGHPRLAPLLKKELLVGLLFTAACTLPTFTRALDQAHAALGSLAAVSAYFAVLAWLNCHAIDRWEACVEQPGESQILMPAGLLAIGGLLLAAFASHGQHRLAALAATGAVSALLLALLDRLRNRLTPLALRAAADLVLLTPLVLLMPLALMRR